MSRVNQIDIIKGIAIVSVIILHTLLAETKTDLYAIYHIGQAVPIFMMVAGFVGYLSYQKKNITDLKKCYHPHLLLSKYKRLCIPFTIIFIFELLIINDLSIIELLKLYLFGAEGVGSYFIPVMFQHIILFPIIYILVVKKSNLALLFLFIIGILFEFSVNVSGSIRHFYSDLYGRYIFAVALGAYIAHHNNKINKMIIVIGSLFSIIYIYLSIYTGVEFFRHDCCIPYQAPAYFYTALLFLGGLYALPSEIGKYSYYVAELGKASWHIFLFQMLHFWLLPVENDTIYSLIFNSVVCLTVGYQFYKLNI